MQFTATFVGRGTRGHFYLEDVTAANGMHRDHAWVNQSYCSLPPLPMPCRIRIEGQYRRYRPGRHGWTISRR